MPVDAVRAVVEGLGGGRQREGIGPAAGLRHGEGGEGGAVEQVGKPARPLFIGGEAAQRDLGAHHLAREGEGEAVVATAVPEPLEGEHGRGEVGALPAELDGHHEAEDPPLGAAAPVVQGELRLVIGSDQVVPAEVRSRPLAGLGLHRVVGFDERPGQGQQRRVGVTHRGPSL